MTASEITLVIGALSTGIVNVIVAIRNGQKSDANAAKLDAVHDRVNGLSDQRDAAPIPANVQLGPTIRP